MSGLLLPALILASLLFASEGSCDNGGSCIVTLKNGNTFAANSYSLEDGKVRLKYKVGEAAFPLAEVYSIENSSGPVKLLQGAGERQALAPPVSAAKQEQRAVAVQDPEAGEVKRASSSYYEARREAMLREDPRAGEMERFIDQYFSAGEAQQEVLDANMDKMLSVLMGDGEDVEEEAGAGEGGPGDNPEETSFEDAFLKGGMEK